MTLHTLVKRVANPKTLWMGVGTVVAGCACASMRGNLEILPAILCLLFVIFLQLMANFMSVYFEMKHELYSKNPAYRIGEEKNLNPFTVRVMREATLATFILSLTCAVGILANSLNAPLWILGGGVIIYGLILLLDIGKYPLSKTPLAPVITFLLFGPLGVVMTSLVQSQREVSGNVWNFYDTAPSLFIGCAMGFLALTIHFCLASMNYSIEKERRYYSITDYIRPGILLLMVFLNGVFELAICIWMVLALHVTNPLLVLVGPFIAFGLNTYISVMLRGTDLRGKRHLITLAIENFVLTGLILLATIATIAPPDDSRLHLF